MMCTLIDRKKDLFIDKVIDLCRDYGFSIAPTDPYEGLEIVSLSDEWIDQLVYNKSSDLPF